MFVKILQEVRDKTQIECQNCRYVNDYLLASVRVWCDQLKLDDNIKNYITREYQFYGFTSLINYLYKLWEPEKREEKDWVGNVKITYQKSKLHNLVAFILNNINVGSQSMEIIVIGAFVVTAVGYWIYILNRGQNQVQQLSLRVEPKQNENPPTIPSLTVNKTINKYFLVLVVSASEAKFLETLQTKSRLDLSDGERLYKITNYLWLGSESEFNQGKTEINNYLVSTREESEYDIHLVYFEIKRLDERFKENINQVDRFDAFRDLANSYISFTVSPRLQMEAYGNFEVYNC